MTRITLLIALGSAWGLLTPTVSAGGMSYSRVIPAIELKALLSSSGDPIELGLGFDSVNRVLKPACIKGSRQTIPNQRSSIQGFSEYKSRSDYKRFAFSASIGVEYLGLGGWLTAATDHNTYQASAQRNFGMSFAYTLPLEVIDSFELTELGKTVLATGDPEFIRLNCGDEAVTLIERGGSLDLQARLYSDRYIENELADVSFEVDLGFTSFTQQLLEIGRHIFREHTYLELDATQAGGSSGQLEALLRERPPACKIDDLACIERVKKFMDRLIQYGSGSGENEFQSIVTKAASERVTDSILTIATIPLSGIIQGFPPSYAQSLPPADRLFLKQIQDCLNQTFGDLAFLQRLRRAGSPHPKEELLYQKLLHNKQVCQSLWDHCYLNREECGADYEGRLEPYTL